MKKRNAFLELLKAGANSYRHYPKKCVSLKIYGFDFLIKVGPFFQI